MKAKVLDLDAKGRSALKKALTGPVGYGVPKYITGYPLVGSSRSYLGDMFDINLEPREGTFNPLLPDLEWRDGLLGLPIWAMSFAFWEKFFPRFFAALRKPNLEWFYVNTWNPKKGLKIVVYRTGEDEWFHIPVRSPEDPYGLLIRTNSVRVKTVTITAEKRARKNLLSHLNRRQRKELILTGCFIERGKSGINYRIRFNRPTIAFREKKGREGLRYETFLGSFCLHPLGYYHNTFAGALAPSDEMLAHLLMIRADEFGFWKEAVRHDIDDPFGGVS